MRGRRQLKLTIPHVVEDTDRHGNVRRYYRRKGKPKVRLWKEPGTPEFLAELEAAKAKAEMPAPSRDAPSKPVKGSLWWVCLEYFEDQEFKRLGKITKKRRRAILESICTSIVPTSPKKHRRGALPVDKMEPKHVREIRDEKAELPEAANMRIKALRQVFRWAVELGHMKANPALDVRYFESDSDGWHTWTIEEVRQYHECWPIGTQARLAIDVLLYTGTRISDACRLGPPMERERVSADGGRVQELHFTEVKNAERKVKRRKEGPKHRELPILPILRATIDATVSGIHTYVINEFGKPFSVGGFGNRIRKWCDEAGLPDCTAHGLRKAGATLAADNGASVHQLMALYGWDSIKEAERYTRQANRRRLARSAMPLLTLPEAGEPDPPVTLHPAFGRKSK